MTKKVVFTGPESSGKSTFAQAISQRLNIPLVSEYARLYLEEKGPQYREEDLLKIAQGQIRLEDKIAFHQKAIVCDTDLITLFIWSQEVYGSVAPFIEKSIAERKYDHYFLMEPTLPWEADPLRENPTDRDRLFKIYLAFLQNHSKKFSIINPSLPQNFDFVLSFTKILIS